MPASSAEALRREVWKIIAANLTVIETRAAVMNLIPNEFHVNTDEEGSAAALNQGSRRAMAFEMRSHNISNDNYPHARKSALAFD